MANYSTLPSLLSDDIECFIFDSIPSTNDYLTNLEFSLATQICITSEQTHGKGQYERKWLSKKDSSVLLSIKQVFSTDTSLNGLSLVVGLAVIDILEEYKAGNLKLKWPNDVFSEHKKLAGILIENSVQNNYQSVVIGLGLNNNLGDSLECKTPWTDLSRLLSRQVDLEELSAKLINNIIKYCNIFEKSGLGYFQNLWDKYDYLANSKLKLQYKGKDVVGVAAGISKQGALLIKVGNEVIESYSSEQISFI